uniref:DNA-directed RNA polymerase subunit n=1 Tax=Euglena clara TaxID=215708 RepID=A0A2Z4YX86_9EUGL|nr:RNA polymerase beta' subunit [Euglena clara]AXA45458.1 RNA polymerase beta' subunit [Euglena clara]
MKEYIKIGLASPRKILNWTERALPNGELIGEIYKSESINHSNSKPILGGLFCEKVFGPSKDWECYCKKYKNVQRKINNNKSINICPKCNVEITESKVRNYRMGIKLSSLVIHTWYIQGIPCYIINIILNKTLKETTKIATNKAYIKLVNKKKENYITGVDAINYLLKKIKLEKTYIENLEQLFNKGFNKDKYEKRKNQYKKRLKIINFFIQNKTKPNWMIIKYLPVLPPNLRPIVKLQDKSIIITDLNFLYGDIITINNKITKLRKMHVPETFLSNEKYILQEKVNKLIKNEKAQKFLTKKKKEEKVQNLKSLTKNLQGKRGLFRENILGKTVDYSGRSVIIVEPNLKLAECGIPKEIRIELLQPFILKKLLQLKIVNSIREGKKVLKEDKIIINKIIEKHYVLLNRAPTLHRIGIQAFQPLITLEKAIQLHPLVCSAFNADFDGDQMGIHIPLSLKAQSEARTLMISTNNFSSPATGQPNISPSQDMVLGCYFLTIENGSLSYLLKKIVRVNYNNIIKAINEYKKENLTIHDYIWINTNNFNKRKKVIKNYLKRTTTGRILFNNILIELI